MKLDNPIIWLAGTIAVSLIGLLASALGSWLTMVLHRRRTIEDENRNVRRELYSKLYFAIIELSDNKGKDLENKFYESYNSIIFYAPDTLLKAVVKWKKEADQRKISKIDSPELKKILDEMRKDLGISNHMAISKMILTPIGKDRSRNISPPPYLNSSSTAR